MSFDAAADAQVYTFAGYIAGEDHPGVPGSVRTGLARARSHGHIVQQMAQWGFQVIAVSALQEVCDAVAALEAIARGDPNTDPADYIHLFGEREPPFNPEHVFALSGQYLGKSTTFAGFAVAADASRLVGEMAQLQFQVQACSSLAELRQTLAEMSAAHEGDENIIDLADIAQA